jgi:CheY-like chemotaxis protein
MAISTILIIIIPLVILFFFLNIAARVLYDRLKAIKRQAEREEALTESLRLDFSRESKTLKRVEVEDPKARILCVDDEEIILDSFRKILVLDGYSVDTVETGQEALGLVQTRDYDFVFTDLKMPAMSGTDVAKSVKYLRPDIDVVIITGYASVETAVEVMKHGAMDYVEKPFSEDELRMFTRNALIKRQDRIRKQLQPRVHVTGPAESGPTHAGEFTIPGGVLVSTGHCWASLEDDGTAKIGLDDFARKLIGKIDKIEFPEVGAQVKAGEPLFGITQGQRQAQFRAPLSGKVVKVNEGLARDSNDVGDLAYGGNWVGMIEGEDLDSELASLKIGKSAVAFFQEEIDRAGAFLKKSGLPGTGALNVGAFEKLDESGWNNAVREFFAAG